MRRGMVGLWPLLELESVWGVVVPSSHFPNRRPNRVPLFWGGAYRECDQPQC
jgi:hypothetical protein